MVSEIEDLIYDPKKSTWSKKALNEKTAKVLHDLARTTISDELKKEDLATELRRDVYNFEVEQRKKVAERIKETEELVNLAPCEDDRLHPRSAGNDRR